MKNRKFNHEILDEIKNHWSPRAFDNTRQITDEELMALFEAARYAPSCFNEQPWRYIITRTPEDREKLLNTLTPSNRIWASKAPVLLLLLAQKKFSKTEKLNRWHQFDAGTSWGFLLLEAQRRGIITHAMGGFDVDLARTTYAIPDEYTLIAVIAVGYYGNVNELSPEMKTNEHPSPRLSIEDILYKN